MDSTTFVILAVIAFVVLGGLLFLVLFEPGLKYRVDPPDIPLDSPAFLSLLGAAGRRAGAPA